MGLPTNVDMSNAARYAAAKCARYRYDHDLYRFPKGYMWWNESVRTKPYYCPPRLAPCPAGAPEFTRKGCKETSCFPYDSSGKPISPESAAPRSKYCYDVFRKWKEDRGGPAIPDTAYHEWDFRKEACVAGDVMLKLWAEQPATRRSKPVRGVTDAPPFRYVEGDWQNSVVIPRNYCEDYMRVSYDPREKRCYVGSGQRIAELFMGTLFRELQ